MAETVKPGFKTAIVELAKPTTQIGIAETIGRFKVTDGHEPATVHELGLVCGVVRTTGYSRVSGGLDYGINYENPLATQVI